MTAYTNEFDFRPSITERPVIRISFIDPNGEAQQTTVSSTWVRGFQALSLTQAPGDSGFARLESEQGTYVEYIQKSYEAMGCTVQRIESICINVQDF